MSREGISVLQIFALSIAQFIIGVFILAGIADIKTIGWYYVIASTFGVLIAILAAVAVSNNKDKK